MNFSINYSNKKITNVKTWFYLCLCIEVFLLILNTPIFRTLLIDFAKIMLKKTVNHEQVGTHLWIYFTYFSFISIILALYSLVNFKNITKTIKKKFNELNQQNTFILIICIGVVLRFLVSFIGHNYDFESWTIVGKIVSTGGNVYNETERYNYSPFFSIILGFFNSMSFGNLILFRLLIIGLLTIADIGISFILYKKYGLYIAILFFLNPISIIITGYHNQFDTLAIFFGLVAITYISKTNYALEKSTIKEGIIIPILFLSLSLITKHLLFIFPIWILINSTISIRNRLLFATIPVLIFLLSFTPYIANGYKGIIANVFKYESENNFPLLLNFSLLQKYFKIIFILLVLLMGFLFRKRLIDNSFYLYLISIVCFSSAIVNQYMAIPLLAVCIIGGRLKYLYIIILSAFLILHKAGLGVYWKSEFSNSFVKAFFESFLSNGYSIAAFILFGIILNQLIPKNKI
jgi:hypothetical protein